MNYVSSSVANSTLVASSTAWEMMTIHDEKKSVVMELPFSSVEPILYKK
jgi:hypothetical protein